MAIEVSGQKITVNVEKKTVTVSVFKGRRGETGATGAQGPQGDTGPQGPQGPPGSPDRTDLSGTVDLDADDNIDVLHTNNTAAATARLPPSADIGSNYYAARFRVTSDNLMRIEARGSDVILFGGENFTELNCADRGGALDVEYIGGGVYFATDRMGQWVEDE